MKNSLAEDKIYPDTEIFVLKMAESIRNSVNSLLKER